MYSRILLASDGATESLVALREGALLARTCHAKVFLLVVDRESAATRVAEGVHPMDRSSRSQALLERGLGRLQRLGVEAAGQAVVGEPAEQIAAFAHRFKADLVVLGHRKQSVLDRWWSGATGAYLTDYLKCSVLVARNVVTDEEFDRYAGPASS